MPKVKTNAQQIAYRFLKDGILALTFKPNQRLTALEVAKKLKLSRTPVREALSRLEQEGLISRHDGWGYFVRPISLKEALDIYKVREVLEVAAIAEAVPNMTDAAIGKLKECLANAEAMLEKKNALGWRDNTRRFLAVILEIAGNVYLARMLAMIDDRIRLLGSMVTDQYFERLQESRQEFRSIFQALKTRNSSAATAAVKNHVTNSRESFLRLAVKNDHSFLTVT